MRIGIVLFAAAMIGSAVAAEPTLQTAGEYFERAKQSAAEGDVVAASLDYRRALILDPGARAIANSYSEFAAKHGIRVRPRSWQDDVVAVVHPESLAIAGSMIGWAGAIWVAWMIFTGTLAGWRCFGAIVAIGIGSAFFAMGWVSDPRIADANLAVVTGEGNAVVLSVPAMNSAKVVDLEPGSAVGVLSDQRLWSFVATPGGANGWIKTERLERVIPSAPEGIDAG